jgi:hypothetical protein
LKAGQLLSNFSTFLFHTFISSPFSLFLEVKPQRFCFGVLLQQEPLSADFFSVDLTLPDNCGTVMNRLWLNYTFSVFYIIPVGHSGLALSSLDGKEKVTKGTRHMVLEDSLGLSSTKQVVQRADELARVIQSGKNLSR